MTPPNRIVGAVLVAGMAMIGSTARAQMCATDADCAAGEVCDGSCRPAAPSPVSAAAPAATPQSSSGEREAPPDALPASSESEPQKAPGWSLGAGISCLILSGLVLALGAGSEATRGAIVPSVPLGVVTTLTLAADVPVAFAGGVSTRRRAAVGGARGLRIASWIGYGLALAGAGVLLGYGAASKEPPPGVIASVSTVGFASGVMMSIDDLIIWSQARRR